MYRVLLYANDIQVLLSSMNYLTTQIEYKDLFEEQSISLLISSLKSKKTLSTA